MVARPDGDAGIGQNGGDIVGMHIVYGKGKDAVVLLRGVSAQKMDVGDLFYALQHEGGEILFPLPDAVEADLFNIVNGGFQPYGPAGVHGPGLELMGDLGVHRALAADGLDHSPPNRKGGMASSHFFLPQSTPMPMGASILWPERPESPRPGPAHRP